MVQDRSDHHNTHMLKLRPGGVELLNKIQVVYIQLVWVCLITHRACCNLAAVKAFQILTGMIKHARIARGQAYYEERAFQN